MEHINEITTSQLQQLMKEDDNVVVVDVREDEEVAQGMIEEAKHIKLDTIPEAVKDLDKNKHYVLVCRSGGRSMKASLFMDEQGIKVTNLTGGILYWVVELIRYYLRLLTISNIYIRLYY